MVQIRQGEVTTANLNAVQVHTYPDPVVPQRRLATITYGFISDGEQITYRTLVEHKPLERSEALALAVRYAEQHGIPEVYEKLS